MQQLLVFFTLSFLSFFFLYFLIWIPMALYAFCVCYFRLLLFLAWLYRIGAGTGLPDVSVQ